MLWNAKQNGKVCQQSIIKAAQKLLMEQYEAQWKRDVSTKPKLNLFYMVKENFKVSKHVSANLDKGKRSLISQLMYSVLLIEVEVGQYTKVSRENCIYKNCKLRVEDEMHFLFHCPVTAAARKLYCDTIPELSEAVVDIEKLKFLVEKPHLFGNYIDKVWQMRIQYVNN